MTEKSQAIKIEAKGLSRYYGPFVAIKDITFAIPEAQIVAFLGPNGAGKTTTMRILSGYLPRARVPRKLRDSTCELSASRRPGGWDISRKTGPCTTT